MPSFYTPFMYHVYDFLLLRPEQKIVLDDLGKTCCETSAGVRKYFQATLQDHWRHQRHNKMQAQPIPSMWQSMVHCKNSRRVMVSHVCYLLLWQQVRKWQCKQHLHKLIKHGRHWISSMTRALMWPPPVPDCSLLLLICNRNLWMGYLCNNGKQISLLTTDRHKTSKAMKLWGRLPTSRKSITVMRRQQLQRAHRTVSKLDYNAENFANSLRWRMQWLSKRISYPSAWE